MLISSSLDALNVFILCSTERGQRGLLFFDSFRARHLTFVIEYAMLFLLHVLAGDHATLIARPFPRGPGQLMPHKAWLSPSIRVLTGMMSLPSSIIGQ